jgi:hypothetical protein
MNIIRCLVEALNPCIHQDVAVATMYDNKDNPQVTTVVSQCEICGRTKRDVFEAAGHCFHKWVTLRRVSIWGKDPKYPTGFSHEQQCEKCGAIRTVKT